MYRSQASTNSRSGRPFSAGASLSEVVGTRLEESYNNEITRSSAHFNLMPKGDQFLGSAEGTYIVGDYGWEKLDTTLSRRWRISKTSRTVSLNR